ncbi:hypothetical protein [Intrasporangium calvum]|uniref:Uncharacterized protein n=1 Tax=Intrasporangium calvum (strain ATCC 23552 / DSM 43043 / JCM 3097 / NBRC 12989 / NCIMB 10167 / NRRL B-3866 / 7 KIP) TaxID=710696 RepID=E6SB27_INTC7|nr:hypothetical protein [Intrasporangium calvum]ADU47288.1 hypothetical protein Intca_0744 [Intrasporangium calvum DSM 43043]AXG12522.1 hypothetical protein DN585_02925 [Intrasporangium calvum]
MSKHIAVRITATMAALTAWVVWNTTRALAYVDPGLGEGSGRSPVPPPTPDPGPSWVAIVTIALVAVALTGLTYSVAHRRRVASGQPA